MKDRAPLRAAFESPNVRAFLAVIDLGEHGPNADSLDRYRTLYGGGLTSYLDDHPRRKVTAAGITSTAAGRGQFLERTWDGLRALYGFPNFSPECQDEGMVALIEGRGALDDVIAGRFEAAIAKCNREWASLPGSPYEQPTLTMDKARERYLERGGFLASAEPSPDAWQADEHYGEAVTESVINPVPSADVQEAHMAPLILPLLQVAAQFLPQLANLFGSGSEVSNRNLAAGKVLADAIVTATNTPNLQAAVEKMQTDPGAVQAAKSAVAQAWPELFEVGGGGIDGARKANAAPEVPLWFDRAFLIGLVLMSAVFMLLVDVFYVHPDNYDANIRVQIVTGVLGFAGIVGAYFLGSSFGSQRKTSILANKE